MDAFGQGFHFLVELKMLIDDTAILILDFAETAFDPNAGGDAKIMLGNLNTDSFGQIFKFLI